jgi:hypothetical protein
LFCWSFSSVSMQSQFISVSVLNGAGKGRNPWMYLSKK